MAFTQIKYLKQAAGQLIEMLTAGVGGGSSTNAIPQTDSTGTLDMTFLKTATAGGGASANLLPLLDGGGQIPATMMPTGIAPAVDSILCSENIPAGSAVQIYNNAGTANVRRADAASGKAANGFVLSAGVLSANVNVYYQGRITGLSGLTPGPVFLGSLGAFVAAPAGGAGTLAQELGVAVSASEVNFEWQQPITLAS